MRADPKPISANFLSFMDKASAQPSYKPRQLGSMRAAGAKRPDTNLSPRDSGRKIFHGCVATAAAPAQASTARSRRGEMTRWYIQRLAHAKKAELNVIGAIAIERLLGEVRA